MNRLATATPVAHECVGRARVLVCGDAMLDRYWFGEVERISPEAPVPVVRVDRVDERAGGAANVAANVAGLGARATLVAVTGDDDDGRRLVERASASGVEVLATTDAALRTVVKLRVIGRAQQIVRLDFEARPSAQALSAMHEAYANALARHDVVVLSDYGKGTLAAAAALVGLAGRAGKPVLVDPKGHDWMRYAGATVVTPNLAELAQEVGPWSDEEGLAGRAQALRTRHRFEALVVTRAAEGMSLYDADGALHVPTIAREVFDVTGAGDTAIAALATLMAAGVPLRDAIGAANRAAGLVVGRFGTARVGWDELFPGATAGGGGAR